MCHLQEKLKRLIKYLNFKEIKNKTQKQTSQEDDEVLEATGKYFICRVFSLMWPEAMQIYWNKRQCSQNSTPTGLVWDTNMVKSAYEPIVAHEVRAYPSFYSMKRLGVFLLPLNGILVLHRVTPLALSLPVLIYQRSKLIFSISRLLATFIFKMVANGKFRSPKIVVSLTQDTSCYLHEGATAERCVRK